MKKFFLLFVFFVLTTQITSAKCCESTPFMESKGIEKIIERDSVALDNAYMTVMRDGAACASANTPNFGTRIIVALEKITTDKYPVEIYSDSKYVIDSITKEWVFNWVKNGFKGKKNEDLWRRFLKVESKFEITYHWVKGHNGHPENERCDVLAVNASKSNLNIDEVYEKIS